MDCEADEEKSSLPKSVLGRPDRKEQHFSMFVME